MEYYTSLITSRGSDKISSTYKSLKNPYLFRYKNYPTCDKSKISSICIMQVTWEIKTTLSITALRQWLVPSLSMSNKGKNIYNKLQSGFYRAQSLCYSEQNWSWKWLGFSHCFHFLTGVA